jgi:hypothetical protein
VTRPIPLLYSAITLAAGAGAAGYWLAGYWTGGLVVVVWSAFWVISIVRQGFRFSSLALVGYAVLVLNAFNAGAQPIFLLLMLVAALAGWDLEFLAVRLLEVKEPDVAEEIATGHIQRLGLTLAMGLVVAGAALLFQFQASFWVALLIAALAAIGLSRLIALIRQPRS